MAANRYQVPCLREAAVNHSRAEGPDPVCTSLFPERSVHLIRQRLHYIGQHIALSGLDMDLRGHAGLQSSGVLEAGLLIVEDGPGDEVGELPLRVLDEV